MKVNKKQDQPSTSAVFIDAIQSCNSGAIAGIITELIFYSLDSYKITKQVNVEQKIVNMNLNHRASFMKLWKGALPIALLGSGPSFGVFFLFYNPVHYYISSVIGYQNESISVLLASVISAIPSSIIAVPADVIKKQLILNNNKNFRITLQNIIHTGGIKQLFLGWKVNLLKDIPFASIKMSLYEGLARFYLSIETTTTIPLSSITNKNKQNHIKSEQDTTIITSNTISINANDLNEIEAATVGFISGVLTAIITCPIDCVNTRIKTGELAHLSIIQAHLIIIQKDGMKALFRGLVPRSLILGFGSTVFWFCHSSCMSFFQNNITSNQH